MTVEQMARSEDRFSDLISSTRFLPWFSMGMGRRCSSINDVLMGYTVADIRCPDDWVLMAFSGIEEQKNVRVALKGGSDRKGEYQIGDFSVRKKDNLKKSVLISGLTFSDGCMVIFC